MKKRKIVLNDKAKISAVIAELDRKKNEALKKAWEQVNKVSHSFYLGILYLFGYKMVVFPSKTILEF